MQRNYEMISHFGLLNEFNNFKYSYFILSSLIPRNWTLKNYFLVKVIPVVCSYGENSSFFFFSFKFIYLYWERERAWAGEGRGENPKQALRCQCRAQHGLNLMNHEIMTWAKTKSWILTRLSHPGTLVKIILTSS